MNDAVDLEIGSDITEEEPATDEVQNAEEFDDDLEYDEEGNIVIPEEDEEFHTEDDLADEDPDHPVPDDAEDEEEIPEENDEADPVKEAPDAEAGAPDADLAARLAARDREYEDLRHRHDEQTAQIKDTLAALGVDSEDELAGLVRLAAEASGEKPEEYLAKRAEEAKKAEAMQMYRRAEFEKKKRADLSEVQALYPETKQYGDIEDIPNFRRFAELRDMGLSPKEAYIAANPDAARESVAAAVKQGALNDTKKHLRSSVPKGAKDGSVRMSRAEFAEWRELFPGKSDKEIVALYRQTIRK